MFCHTACYCMPHIVFHLWFWVVRKEHLIERLVGWHDRRESVVVCSSMGGRKSQNSVMQDFHLVIGLLPQSSLFWKGRTGGSPVNWECAFTSQLCWFKHNREPSTCVSEHSLCRVIGQVDLSHCGSESISITTLAGPAVLGLLLSQLLPLPL